MRALSRRWLLASLTVLVLGAGVFLVGCALSAPGYQGPRSSHFDGTKFHNLVPRPGGPSGFGDFARWMVNYDRARVGGDDDPCLGLHVRAGMSPCVLDAWMHLNGEILARIEVLD